MKKFFVTPYLFFITLTLAFLLCNSCSEKNNSTPSGIIGKDKMVDVLVDVQLAEASSDNRGLGLPQINRLMATRYEAIFKKHKTNFDQFKSSYDYYLDNPEVLSEIYTEVANRLTTLQSKVKSQTKPKSLPRQKRDSLPKSPSPSPSP